MTNSLYPSKKDKPEIFSLKKDSDEELIEYSRFMDDYLYNSNISYEKGKLLASLIPAIQ